MAGLIVVSEAQPESIEAGQWWYQPSQGTIWEYFGSGVLNPVIGGEAYTLDSPFSVFIAGVRVTDKIKIQTFNKKDNLTYQVDTLQFEIYDDDGTLGLKEGQEIAVFDYSTADKYFGGEIAAFEQIEQAPGSGTYFYRVECVDWQKKLQRKLVIESYTSKTIAYIVADIVSKYATEFTYANVSSAFTVNYISFNYKDAASCLQELAGLAGYGFYVDYYKDIHIFESTAENAPYSIDDDLTVSGHHNNLTIKVDKTQYRNRIYIQGGYYLSNDYPQSIVADGVQKEYLLAYPPYASSSGAIVVEVSTDGGGSWTTKTLGIDNIDSTGYDFVVSVSEKLIKNLDYATLSAGHILRVTYQFKIPILTQDDDYGSQDAIKTIEGGDGVYEYHIVDEQVETLAAAHDRAQAELNDYADPVISGSFNTDQYGYKSGQLLTINSALRGYEDRTFSIQSVTTTMKSGNVRNYNVVFATRLKGLTEFLKGIYLSGRKILIREDETLNDLASVTVETFTLADAAATFDETTPPFKYDAVNSVYGEAQYG